MKKEVDCGEKWQRIKAHRWIFKDVLIDKENFAFVK